MADYPLYVMRMKQSEIRGGSIWIVQDGPALPFVTITDVPKQVTLGRATEDSNPMIDLKFQTISRNQGMISFNEKGKNIVYSHKGRVPAQIRWGANYSESTEIFQEQSAEFSTSLGVFMGTRISPENLRITQYGPVLRYSSGNQRFLDIDIVMINWPKSN